MPILLTLIIIIALMYILLLFPIIVTADLSTEPKIFIKFLFFTIPLEPRKSKTKRQGKSGKKSKVEKSKKKKPKQAISHYIEKYGDAVKTILAAAGKLLKRVVIKRLDVSVTVGGEDAAQIAVEYGAVCAVAYPIISMIDSNITVKESNISIKPDFNAKTQNGELYIDLRIKALHVSAVALGLIKRLIKFFVK